MPIIEDPETRAALLDHATEIVCAFVSHNAVPVADLPGLIARTYDALQNLTLPQQPAETPAAGPIPAVLASASVHDEHLISLIDGRPYKMLRRHLTAHGYTPGSYRKAFNLPADYPVTAAAHSRHRSALAKAMGLGSQRNKAAIAAASRKPAKAAA